MGEDLKIKKGSVTLCWNDNNQVQYYGLSDKALDRIQKIAETEHTKALNCPVKNIFPNCDRASYNIETCGAEGISCPFDESLTTKKITASHESKCKTCKKSDTFCLTLPKTALACSGYEPINESDALPGLKAKPVGGASRRDDG